MKIEIDAELPTPRGKMGPPPPRPSALLCSGGGGDSSSTAASSLKSGGHGRVRRGQRSIRKVSLQQARRHGMRERVRFGRMRYTFGGVAFVYDPARNREVTSYKTEDDRAGDDEEVAVVAGTRVVPPLSLQIKHEYYTKEHIRRHKQVRQELWNNRGRWTSHTVLVIDYSGSMRTDDVNGARCRSDGVWMSLARDFIGHQLTTGLASETDVASVVIMRETATTVLTAEPMDWVLYNDFLTYREWTELKRPEGHGHYLPALQKAEELLHLNPKCSLALFFCSDGKPSDKGDFAAATGRMAASFGRRLTVTCLGMASTDADLSVMQAMADEAAAYGAVAAMQKPALHTEALSTSIRSTLVSSVAASRTALTDVRTGKMRAVRTDLLRERHDAAEETALSDKWQCFTNDNPACCVQRVWTWDRRRDDFAYVIDCRCIFCYRFVGTPQVEADHDWIFTVQHKRVPGTQCPACKACFICADCNQTNHGHMGSAHCQDFADDRRKKVMTQKTVVPFFHVAMKKYVFGEGVERIVRSLRFLDDEGKNFVGPQWVAKESRFENEVGQQRYSDMDYHREFMRTQVLASDFAAKFNEALDELKGHFHPAQHEWLDKLPRFRYLEPLVLEVKEDGVVRHYLVEEKLQGKYQKFNNNMGYVVNRPKNGLASLQEESDDDDSHMSDPEEDEEVDEESNADHHPYDGHIFHRKQVEPNYKCHYTNVRVEDFPQAFSHFTYEKSKKRLMVVDLQGVLRTKEDGTREYLLTDPAIHRRGTTVRLGDFGRTDRGEKGLVQKIV